MEGGLCCRLIRRGGGYGGGTCIERGRMSAGGIGQCRNGWGRGVEELSEALSGPQKFWGVRWLCEVGRRGR